MGLQSNTSDFHVRTDGLKVNRPALKWKPAWFRQWRHSLVEKFDTQVLKWFECFGLWFSYRLLPTFPCRLKKAKGLQGKKASPQKDTVRGLSLAHSAIQSDSIIFKLKVSASRNSGFNFLFTTAYELALLLTHRYFLLFKLQQTSFQNMSFQKQFWWGS